MNIIYKYNLIYILHIYYIHIVYRNILTLGLLASHIFFVSNEFSFNKQTKPENPKKTLTDKCACSEGFH